MHRLRTSTTNQCNPTLLPPPCTTLWGWCHACAVQMFRVLFNSTWPWKIQQDLWIFSAIRWTLFKMLVLPAGEQTWPAVLELYSTKTILWVGD